LQVLSKRDLVPLQISGILKIVTTHIQRSWTIFEEAGIFTRHAFWRLPLNYSRKKLFQI